jgi:hypothetical protein
MKGGYIITESSPSTTTYMRSGRGGMGNTFRAAPTTVRSAVSSSSQPAIVSQPSSSSSSSASSRRFFSGIGGAGNVHSASERPALSLDDDFRRAAARDAAPVGYTGIGGWGNVYRRKQSDASDSSASTAVDDDVSSETSSMTTKSKMWARAAVAGIIHRSWRATNNELGNLAPLVWLLFFPLLLFETTTTAQYEETKKTGVCFYTRSSSSSKSRSRGPQSKVGAFTVHDVFGSGEFAVYTIPPPVDGFLSSFFPLWHNQRAIFPLLHDDEMDFFDNDQKWRTRAKTAKGSMLARMGLSYIYNLTDYICQKKKKKKKKKKEKKKKKKKKFLF